MQSLDCCDTCPSDLYQPNLELLQMKVLFWWTVLLCSMDLAFLCTSAVEHAGEAGSTHAT